MINWLWRRRMARCPYCGQTSNNPVCDECAARVREVRQLMRPRGMRSTGIFSA
jgi:hypothetical protein